MKKSIDKEKYKRKEREKLSKNNYILRKKIHQMKKDTHDNEGHLFIDWDGM